MPYATHQELDFLTLEMHRSIAEKILGEPSLIQVAIQKILSWPPHPTRTEWLGYLRSLSPHDLALFICRDDDDGQRLRQSSPLTFCLSQEERNRFL